MQNEIDAMHEIINITAKHQIEHAEKLADLYKTVIAVSGVMVSVLAALRVGGPELHSQSPWLLQLSFFLFLLSVLFGCVALHGNAHMHTQAIDAVAKLVKQYSPPEVLQKLAFAAVEQKGLYLFASNLSLPSFFFALFFLTCYSILNI